MMYMQLCRYDASYHARNLACKTLFTVGLSTKPDYSHHVIETQIRTSIVFFSVSTYVHTVYKPPSYIDSTLIRN